MSIELYNYLTMYGSVSQTKHRMENPKEFVDWTEKNFTYVQYNPRKNIKRFGLSITSLDGNLTGKPDLDSLLEYNRENSTTYSEKDFRKKTPVYYYQQFEKIIEPISDNIFRTHVIKLDPSGYFPPHRDFYGTRIDSFRLIMPLLNCNPPELNFVFEDRILKWDHGSIYFVDTAKVHWLFNIGPFPAYMIVFNVDLNEHTIKYVTENFKYL
jgi:hypothetical protein